MAEPIRSAKARRQGRGVQPARNGVISGGLAERFVETCHRALRRALHMATGRRGVVPVSGYRRHRFLVGRPCRGSGTQCARARRDGVGLGGPRRANGGAGRREREKTGGVAPRGVGRSGRRRARITPAPDDHRRSERSGGWCVDKSARRASRERGVDDRSSAACGNGRTGWPDSSATAPERCGYTAVFAWWACRCSSTSRPMSALTPVWPAERPQSKRFRADERGGHSAY